MFGEYKTVTDFIIGCGDFCVEHGLTSLKYGGTTDDGVYKVNKDDCEFLLPYSNNCVLGIGDWRQHLGGMSISLPGDMTSYGKSYINTFLNAQVVGNSRINEFCFGDKYISTEGMFRGAKFRNFGGELIIRDSKLDINSMFYCSHGLKTITFKNCELVGLQHSLEGSGVEHVIFDNCSNSFDFSDYKGCAYDVFHLYMTKLTLKNCDCGFVNTVMKMFNGDEYFKDLEIEILD